MEKREGGAGPARSLALLGPVRGPVRPPLAAHGGRRPSSRSRSPPSAPAVASPAPRRPVGDPLSRPAVSFRSVSLGGGARPFPRRGKGSAPRRRPAVAPGRSRLRARRVSSRRRSPLPRFRPRPLSGYLATASRRVGLKTPGGSPLRPRGRGDGGARRGPSRRLPRTPVPEAACRRRGGLGAPLGRPWGSPPRARFAGASSVAGLVSVGPDPLPSVVLSLVSLAGPRRTPLRSPAASPGAAGGEGTVPPSALFFPEGKKRSYDS